MKPQTENLSRRRIRALRTLRFSPVLGQLRQKKKAKTLLDEAFRLNPDLRKNSRRYLSRLIYSGEIVDHIIEGLRKAGLTG